MLEQLNDDGFSHIIQLRHIMNNVRVCIVVMQLVRSRRCRSTGEMRESRRSGRVPAENRKSSLSIRVPRAGEGAEIIRISYNLSGFAAQSCPNRFRA